MTAYISPGSMSEEVVALIPALRAFAHTFYRHPNDADDLVQETLVKALSNLDHFKEGTRLKSWLFTIMRNSFCTRYRIAKRETVCR
jgi:RNA polymerase sigma-70 factor (ECF subfamily)